MEETDRSDLWYVGTDEQQEEFEESDENLGLQNGRFTSTQKLGGTSNKLGGLGKNLLAKVKQSTCQLIMDEITELQKDNADGKHDAKIN